MGDWWGGGGRAGVVWSGYKVVREGAGTSRKRSGIVLGKIKISVLEENFEILSDQKITTWDSACPACVRVWICLVRLQTAERRERRPSTLECVGGLPRAPQASPVPPATSYGPGPRPVHALGGRSTFREDCRKSCI